MVHSQRVDEAKEGVAECVVFALEFHGKLNEGKICSEIYIYIYRTKTIYNRIYKYIILYI